MGKKNKSRSLRQRAPRTSTSRRQSQRPTIHPRFEQIESQDYQQDIFRGVSVQRCHVCSLYFTSIDTLTRHYNRMHCDFNLMEMKGQHAQRRPVPPIGTSSLRATPKPSPSVQTTQAPPTSHPTANCSGLVHCSLCKVKVPDLKSHYLEMHVECRCPCWACTSVLKNESAIVFHCNSTQAHASCLLCDLKFLTLVAYKQHMTDDHIRKCTVAQCITCDTHFDTIDALFAHIDAVHESGDIDAKSRLLQYSGPIKAATDGQDDEGETPPPSAEVSSMRTGISVPPENTCRTEPSDAEDKAIPAIRGALLAPADSEECTSSDASASLRDKFRKIVKHEVSGDGGERSGVPRGTSTQGGGDTAERNIGHHEKVSEDASGNPVTIQADLHTSRASSVTPVATSATSTNNGAHRAVLGNKYQQSEDISPPFKCFSAPADNTTAHDVFEHSRVPVASFTCKVCGNNPVDPTLTICGHLFCHRCIAMELSKNLCCPACGRIMLVRIQA